MLAFVNALSATLVAFEVATSSKSDPRAGEELQEANSSVAPVFVDAALVSRNGKTVNQPEPLFVL